MRIGIAFVALVAAAVFTATTQAQPNCPSGEIVKLSSIAKAGSPYQQRTADTKFTIIPIVGEPTEAQWKAISTTPSCSAAAGNIRALVTLGDCNIVSTAMLNSFNVFRYGRDYDILCSPYTSAPSPSPAPTMSAPTPVSATSVPTSALAASAPTQISQPPTPALITEAPTPTPSSQASTPLAATGAPSPVPISLAPAPAPVTAAPTPPTTTESTFPEPAC